MNKVILMGRLTHDPEISSSTSGTMFARFSIAVDRRYKQEGQPEADFFNCTAIGKQADFVDKYLRKGIKVVIVGRLKNESYTNKEGLKVYFTKVITEEIDFAESKKDGQQRQDQTQTTDGFLNIPDGIDIDELPFS